MNEKMEILTMLQEGKITADEAERLLEALGTEESNNSMRITHTPKKGEKPKMIKIEVRSDEDTVDINVPLSLAKFGTAFVQTAGIKDETVSDINFEQIFVEAEKGTIGNIVDIKSKSGETVKIYIE